MTSGTHGSSNLGFFGSSQPGTKHLRHPEKQPLKSLNLSLARIAVKIVTGTAMQLFDHGHKYGKNLKASYGADLGVNGQS
jgi:hypothetical protein